MVIENGQSPEERLPDRPISKGETRNRFGFFGQINPFKGIDVLLESLMDLPEIERKKIVLEVHGANLEWQAEAFKEKIAKMIGPLTESGCLRWVGPYQPHELRARMSGVDWIVVPSIWWENSPMVIQEAFVLGRPLLVSNIGGMAEKVRDGIDGVHVAVGNKLDWASKFLGLAKSDSAWLKHKNGIKQPLTYAECAKAHVPLVS